jgi:acyl-coenzyme A thioesterase PaaI-like protein
MQALETVEAEWQQRLAEISDQVTHLPFYRWLGLRVVAVERGRASVELPATAAGGRMAGAQRDAAFAAADAAAAVAVMTVSRPGEAVTPVEARLHYLASLAEEGAIAEAVVQRKGHRLSTVAVTVSRPDGVVAARGQLTCAIGGGRRAAVS